MSKITQFRLTDKADEIVTLFKVKNKIKTKGETINRIIEQYVGVDENELL